MTDIVGVVPLVTGSGVTVSEVVNQTLVGGTAAIMPVTAPWVNGAPVSGVNPTPEISAGTTGTDFSGGSAAGGIGAGTSSAIPVAGFVLLTTVPVNAARALVEVQNQSAAMLQIVRDDGTGLNQSTVLLASSGVAGSAGGIWSSRTFKGRLRVYGATGAQVSAYQD